MKKQPAQWRARLRALRWRRIAVGLALVFAVIAFVPPFRRAAADATSKVILFVAAPLAPSVSNFNSISANTRIVAADGSEIAQLNGGQQRKPVKRHPVGDKASEQFGFVMPSNSDWSAILDEFFKADGGYRNSTEYKSILRKHLGETGMKLLQSATK